MKPGDARFCVGASTRLWPQCRVELREEIIHPVCCVTSSRTRPDCAGGAWERTGTLIRDDGFGLLARHFEAMTQRLQHRFGALAEQRGRRDSLVEAAIDAIVLINEKGIIERCNKAIEPLFAYPPHELVGQNVNVLMSGVTFQTTSALKPNCEKPRTPTRSLGRTIDVTSSNRPSWNSGGRNAISTRYR